MRTALPSFLLLSLVLGFAAPVANARCKKADPKKVILVIDNNGGINEVEAVERAACARGETLVVIPEDYKEFGRLQTSVVEAKREQMSACAKGQRSAPQCEAARKAADSAENVLDTYSERSQKVTTDVLRAELDRQKKAGIQISSLVISGHDGGGHFNGVSGNLDRYDLTDLAKDFGAQFQNVQSLALLGCYTGVHREIRGWKDLFPQMKILAGYEGRAPLSDTKAGHTFVEDLLKREAKLIHAANEKQLEKDLNEKVRGIADLNAAVYVQTDCKVCKDKAGRPEYFYRPQRKLGPKLVMFDSKECETARQAYPPVKETYDSFFYGKQPIPEETNGTPLRQAYEFFRVNEHCFEEIQGHPRADQSLFLLFYHDVKKSFAKHFEKLMGEVSQILNRLTPEELHRRSDEEIQVQVKRRELFAQTIERVKKDPAETRAELESARASVGAELIKLDKDPEYRKAASISALERAHASGDLMRIYQKHAELRKKRADLSDALKLAQSGYSDAQFDSFLKERDEDIADLRSRNEMRIKNTLADKAKLWSSNSDSLKSRSREEIRAEISNLADFRYDRMLKDTETPALRELYRHMNRMLFNLDCVPFNWHEYRGRPDKPNCDNH